MARTADGVADPLEPVKKETIPRVAGSAALKMHDHNYISVPRAIAGQGTPIVINNACCSWHRLAGDYTFGNARAYIGTLFPVTGAVAHDVVVKLLDKHFGKPLAAALWSAQREVYGNAARRPYIANSASPSITKGGNASVPPVSAVPWLNLFNSICFPISTATGTFRRPVFLPVCEIIDARQLAWLEHSTTGAPRCGIIRSGL